MSTAKKLSSEDKVIVQRWLERAKNAESKLAALEEIYDENVKLLEKHPSPNLKKALESNKEEIQIHVNAVAKYRLEIYDAINELRNDQYITILTHKYLNHHTIDEIAELMECNSRTIVRKHLTALYELNNIFINKNQTVIECH